MAPSSHAKSALLKTRESHISLVWVNLHVYLHDWVKSKLSDNSSPPILVNVQRLHENG